MAQQRKTVLQARQMGMDAAAIAALVGLAKLIEQSRRLSEAEGRRWFRLRSTTYSQL